MALGAPALAVVMVSATRAGAAPLMTEERVAAAGRAAHGDSGARRNIAGDFLNPTDVRESRNLKRGRPA